MERKLWGVPCISGAGMEGASCEAGATEAVADPASSGSKLASVVITIVNAGNAVASMLSGPAESASESAVSACARARASRRTLGGVTQNACKTFE